MAYWSRVLVEEHGYAVEGIVFDAAKMGLTDTFQSNCVLRKVLRSSWGQGSGQSIDVDLGNQPLGMVAQPLLLQPSSAKGGSPLHEVATNHEHLNDEFIVWLFLLGKELLLICLGLGLLF